MHPPARFWMARGPGFVGLAGLRLNVQLLHLMEVTERGLHHSRCTAAHHADTACNCAVEESARACAQLAIMRTTPVATAG